MAYFLFMTEVCDIPRIEKVTFKVRLQRDGGPAAVDQDSSKGSYGA